MACRKRERGDGARGSDPVDRGPGRRSHTEPDVAAGADCQWAR